MSFDDRIKKASAFEKLLFEKIEGLGFIVAVNGTEHTHPEFTRDLRQSTDQTSLAIRFQPDGVARIGKIPRSFYVEAKSSKTIERTAYEQYKKLSDVGNIVVVVFCDFGWKWCFVDEMPLEDGADTVSCFTENRRFPVKDGWLYPRQTEHGTSGKGSGTPYRRIVEKDLREWPTLKMEILNRLKR